ncbi:MAG: hypothetical protein WCD21_41620 [Streptomyces sp.]
MLQQSWAHLLGHRALRELMFRTAAAQHLDPDRVSFTETLRSARRSVTVTPGSFPPDLLVRTLVLLEHDLLERLLPLRRLRSQPRVVKRKMSNYLLKRAKHRTWPQPIRAGVRTVLVQRPQPTNGSCAPSPFFKGIPALLCQRQNSGWTGLDDHYSPVS